MEVEAYGNGSKTKPSGQYKAVTSTAYGMLYYKKLGYKIKMIDYMEHAKGNIGINCSNNNVLIKFTSYASRKYVGPLSFAALLGALAEVGYKDVKINGFTIKDGTGSPSKTHPKGINADIAYLRTDEIPASQFNITDKKFDEKRMIKLVNALITFGYKDMISYKFGINKDKLLPNARQVGGHKNHLHIQKFEPNI